MTTAAIHAEALGTKGCPLPGDTMQRVMRKLLTPVSSAAGSDLNTMRNLQFAYAAARDAGHPASLMVVHVTNLSADMFSLLGPALRMRVQRDIVTQLHRVSGTGVYVAPVGHDEYAILLPGIAQCSELIGRVQSLLSRARAGRLNGDGRELHCRVGIARAGIDAERLPDLLNMASCAALEPVPSPSYEFVNQRHRLLGAA